MVLLLVRLAILVAVVGGASFGVVYGIRKMRQSKAVKGLRREVEALKAGHEEGIYSDDEFATQKKEIQTRCRELGVNINS